MGTKIAGIKTYLPEYILTNEELASTFGRWTSDKIEKKLGIKERHISGSGETALHSKSRLFFTYYCLRFAGQTGSARKCWCI